MEVKYYSANQRPGPCLICNHSSKVKQHFLRITHDKSSSKCQGPRYPSWISHCFKKIQYFFMTTRGTFVVSLVTWFWRRSWKFEKFTTYEQTTDRRTLDTFRSSELKTRILQSCNFLGYLRVDHTIRCSLSNMYLCCTSWLKGNSSQGTE